MNNPPADWSTACRPLGVTLGIGLFCSLVGTIFLAALLTTCSGLLPTRVDSVKTSAGSGRGITIAQYPHVEADSVPALVQSLREFDLWHIDENSAIQPMVLTRYPVGLSRQPVQAKKRVFFNAILPSVLIVAREIEEEKIRLQSILACLDGMPEGTVLVSSPDLAESLSPDEGQFVRRLADKYRTGDLNKLVRRVETIPVSLILAQSAIESSWGSSRFAQEGNNLFGTWTWKEPGIVPDRREADKTHKVARYPTMIDSIRAYCLNLNRLTAYTEFRVQRLTTRDSCRLAEELRRYAEKGEEYVKKIQSVIRTNTLQKYDTCYLVDSQADQADR